MLMLSEGLKNKLIEWPEPFAETGYHMITFTKAKPKPKKKDDEEDADKKDDKKEGEE